MGISIDFESQGGFEWDFRSGSENPFGDGLVVRDGTRDAFDGAYDLSVNGITVAPETAVAGLSFQRFETAPFAIDADSAPGEQTVLVSREVFVSDGSLLNSLSFARFLEAFTNISDRDLRLAVAMESNMGSDAATILRDERFADDRRLGWVTDDGTEELSGDPPVVHAWGDGRPGSLREIGSGFTDVEGDETTVAFTLDLAPGETARLMHFASQSTISSQASNRLSIFTAADAEPFRDLALTGLDQTVRDTIVNYDASLPDDDFRLFGRDGGFVGWGRESGALRFDALPSIDWFQARRAPGREAVSTAFDPEARTAEFVSSDARGNLYRLSWWAPEDAPWVRMHMEFENRSGRAEPVFFDVSVFDEGDRGFFGSAEDMSLVHVGRVDGGINRWVADDLAEDGVVSGFLNPFGAAIGGAAMPTLDAEPQDGAMTAFSLQTVAAGETAGWLAYLTEGSSLLEATATVEALAAPGPRALAGLDRDAVARLISHDLGEGDRLETRSGGRGDDALEAADGAAARLLGRRGDDELTGGAFDDLLKGGGGEDAMLGLGGADTIRGGGGADVALGGAGADALILGGGGDVGRGGRGDDRVSGGGGNDVLRGGAGDDRLADGKGRDVLIGGRGEDLFELSRDGVRDLIRGFEIGEDEIAVSAGRFRALKIKDARGGVKIVDEGETTLVKGPGLSADDFGRGDFVFG